MAPRNFSEDGAVGAASPGETPNGGFGAGMQPSIMNGFMPTSSPGSSDAQGAGLGMAMNDTSPSDNGSAPSMYSGAGPVSHMSAHVGGSSGAGMTQPMPRQPQVTNPLDAYSNNAFSYAAGGAIDEDPNATDPQGSMMGANLQASINAALGVVNKALSYGRNKHGMSGGGGDEQGGEAIQTADRMPTVPGNPYGQQREQPMPGPLPPTKNPFGKRAEGEGDQQVAGMPSVPFSETPKPQPMPGPLPPTNNPFGKRADAGGGDEAIPMDDEEMA